MGLSLIEISVVVLLLVMTVPDLCRRVGRPSLIYVIYLLCGLFLAPWIPSDVRGVVGALGEIGFILLLFEIGLEIELPKLAELYAPGKFAFIWSIAQVPLVLLLAVSAGLGPVPAMLAYCSLCACSVGIAFPGWLYYPFADPHAKKVLLHWMILVEVSAMIVLTAGSALLRKGVGTSFAFTVVGIIAIICAIGLFANRAAGLIARFSRNTLRWRVHYWVLLVLFVSIAGRWAGLSPAKAAFFLGLFISRTTHEGLALGHHLRPIGQHLLIPMFFLSLGGLVPPEYWLSSVGFSAVVSAMVILLFRRLLQGRLPQDWKDRQVYLLVTPNLTIAAVAVQVMQEAGLPVNQTAWLLMVSAILTLLSLVALRSKRPADNHCDQSLTAMAQGI